MWLIDNIYKSRSDLMEVFHFDKRKCFRDEDSSPQINSISGKISQQAECESMLCLKKKHLFPNIFVLFYNRASFFIQYSFFKYSPFYYLLSKYLTFLSIFCECSLEGPCCYWAILYCGKIIKINLWTSTYWHSRPLSVFFHRYKQTDYRIYNLDFNIYLCVDPELVEQV